MEKWKSLLFVLLIMLIVGGVVFMAPTISSGTVSDAFSNDVARMVLGAIGAMMILVSLVYGVEKIKEGEYAMGLIYPFIGILVGTIFVLSWLWS